MENFAHVLIYILEAFVLLALVICLELVLEYFDKREHDHDDEDGE